MIVRITRTEAHITAADGKLRRQGKGGQRQNKCRQNKEVVPMDSEYSSLILAQCGSRDLFIVQARASTRHHHAACRRPAFASVGLSVTLCKSATKVTRHPSLDIGQGSAERGGGQDNAVLRVCIHEQDSPTLVARCLRGEVCWSI